MLFQGNSCVINQSIGTYTGRMLCRIYQGYVHIVDEGELEITNQADACLLLIKKLILK